MGETSGGETSWWQNIQWRGETSRGQNVKGATHPVTKWTHHLFAWKHAGTQKGRCKSKLEPKEINNICVNYYKIKELFTTSSSRSMRVINHDWSATKQRLHPQSVAEISSHSVLSGTGFDNVRHRLGLFATADALHKRTLIIAHWLGWTAVVYDILVIKHCSASLRQQSYLLKPYFTHQIKSTN